MLLMDPFNSSYYETDIFSQPLCLYAYVLCNLVIWKPNDHPHFCEVYLYTFAWSQQKDLAWSRLFHTVYDSNIGVKRIEEKYNFIL